MFGISDKRPCAGQKGAPEGVCGALHSATRSSDLVESRRGPLKSAVPSNVVSPVRRCSRTACGRPAVATLTYVYADSTAVLGPLATYAEPHCYDLCAEHSERLTAPRGWEVVRLLDGSAPAQPSGDDLEALANAVREAAKPQQRAAEAGDNARSADPMEVARRGHLRVLRSPDN
ncbi:hypothetical protein GCM10010365_41540 [Streptomyces poonensis]|uniref:DUF3499 domain-containing protein n=1 Tax=Streptomyces poonensis TaxID=68255 RepID=A0A918UKU9_9ACTN|nr:hypothetical protein GCM10010365_41540 [Streptomyces poonensis]GLJ92448.1 hypothetical protein GCM10017589_50570 [Streptomyces poonensis]